MKAIVFLFALVAFAAATDATMDALNEVNAQPLGNALLLAVKTSIDAGNSVEDVSRFLHQLQTKEENNNAELKSDYKNELTELNNTISSLEALTKNLRNDIKALEAKIVRLQGELKDAKEAVAAARTKQNQTQEAWDKTQADYATNRKNLVEDIKASVQSEKAVAEALVLVERYQAAVATSLVQLKSESHSGLASFAKKLDEMKHVIIAKAPESSALVHELVVLCQAPANAGVKADRIKTLLEQLETAVKANLAQERINLDNLDEQFQKDQEYYTGELTRLAKLIATLDAQIVSLGSQIESSQTSLKEKKETLVDNEKTLKNKRELRTDRIAYYTAAIKKSDKNVEILKKLVDAFDKNVNAATSYAKNAAQTGKGF